MGCVFSLPPASCIPDWRPVAPTMDSSLHSTHSLDISVLFLPSKPRGGHFSLLPNWSPLFLPWYFSHIFVHSLFIKLSSNQNKSISCQLPGWHRYFSFLLCYEFFMCRKSPMIFHYFFYLIGSINLNWVSMMFDAELNPEDTRMGKGWTLPWRKLTKG